MTPEAKVKDKIKKILKEHGVYYAMPMGTGYGNAGVPDFLCCVHGKFLAIEAKAGSGKTTALQDKNLSAIHDCGGFCTFMKQVSNVNINNNVYFWARKFLVYV